MADATLKIAHKFKPPANLLKYQTKKMKKIGLVGGISWTSTLDYYKFINRIIQITNNSTISVENFDLTKNLF